MATFYLLLPDPEPEPVDAELLPGEGVPGSGSGDWSGIAEPAEATNWWGCKRSQYITVKLKNDPQSLKMKRWLATFNGGKDFGVG